MKYVASSILALGLAAGALAAVPPAQSLLPDDTLAMFTVPDVAKAYAAFTKSPQAQFWNDPAMKAFREHFLAKWSSEVLGPLERELGIKLADYHELAQGQFTLAVIRNGWNGGTNPEPAVVILLDAGAKADQLTQRLAGLRKQWAESGKQLRVEKIRDLEFSVLGISATDISSTLKRVFGETNTAPITFEPESRLRKEDVFVGQSGSLLLVGKNAKVLEKILARLAGSPMPALNEQAAYESVHTSLFRDALAFGWLDAKRYLGAISDEAARDAETDVGPTFFPSANKVLAALGLLSLKTAAFSVQADDEGVLLQAFFGAPASERAGLLKILTIQQKEAAPPAFVPADAVKFRRIRADLPQTWADLEATLGKLTLSESDAAIRQALDVVGKDKDPNFDFRKTLLASLGDDIITYEKLPQGNTVAEFNTAPSLMLIGSPNQDQLLLAFKALTSLFPPQMGGGNELKEREFLGRKIYTLAPAQFEELGASSGVGMHFAASGGYLAISGTPALLEEYIRSAESPGKALREKPGLLDAAQKVGGPGAGLFGFSDEAAQIRVLFEALRRDPQSANRLQFMPTNPLDPISRQPQVSHWFDFALLPEFSQVAKYFNFTVHGASATDAGLGLKYFLPSPPELRK